MTRGQKTCLYSFCLLEKKLIYGEDEATEKGGRNGRPKWAAVLIRESFIYPPRSDCSLRRRFVKGKKGSYSLRGRGCNLRKSATKFHPKNMNKILFNDDVRCSNSMCSSHFPGQDFPPCTPLLSYKCADKQ